MELSEPRRRLLGLVAVAVGGFVPSFAQMLTGFRLTPGALAVVLLTSASGAILGAIVLRDARRVDDVPSGAFGGIALLSGVGWFLGAAASVLLF